MRSHSLELEQGQHTERLLERGAFEKKLPTLVLIWLLLTVLAPHPDLYKAWFHLVFAIPLLIMLPLRRVKFNTHDSLFRVSMVLIGYTGLSSVFVSSADLAGHAHALRWCLEVGLLVTLLFVALPKLIETPLYLGRVFLACALMGAIASLAIFGLFEQFNGRLYGLGALSNPVQAPSVLIVYLALGGFLFWTQRHQLTRRDHALLVATLALTFVVAFLSESRGPVLAMSLSLIYLFLVSALMHRAWKTLMITTATLILALGAVLMFFSVDGLMESMLERGTSYRFILWSALLEHLPNSIIFGHGAATDLRETAAGIQILRQTGFENFHAHNLFIGTFVASGLLGLLLLLAIFAVILKAIYSAATDRTTQLYMLGMVGLVTMLCLTSSYTLVISVKAFWLYTWVPLIFLWLWAKNETREPVAHNHKSGDKSRSESE